MTLKQGTRKCFHISLKLKLMMHFSLFNLIIQTVLFLLTVQKWNRILTSDRKITWVEWIGGFEVWNSFPVERRVTWNTWPVIGHLESCGIPWNKHYWFGQKYPSIESLYFANNSSVPWLWFCFPLFELRLISELHFFIMHFSSFDL